MEILCPWEMVLAHLHRCQEDDQAIVGHQVHTEITACYLRGAATDLEVEAAILLEAATHPEEAMALGDHHSRVMVEAGTRAVEEVAIRLRDQWDQWDQWQWRQEAQ
jgi:hypothetical protein